MYFYFEIEPVIFIFITIAKKKLIPVRFLLIDGYQNQQNKIEGFLIAGWITREIFKARQEK